MSWNILELEGMFLGHDTSPLKLEDRCRLGRVPQSTLPFTASSVWESPRITEYKMKRNGACKSPVMQPVAGLTPSSR